MLALTGCESCGENLETIPEPITLVNHEMMDSAEIRRLDRDEVKACYLRIYELEAVIIETQIWYRDNFNNSR